MTIPELDIAPRTRGRAAAPISAEMIRDLNASDLALLASERQVKPPAIVRIRDRHHALAKYIAQGHLKDHEISLITGYDISRISILKSDPTFQQLVEDYRRIDNNLQAEFMDRAAQVAMTAMDIIVEKMEDAPEDVTLAQATDIAKTFADRIGHAPVQKTINTNVNVDLGSKLAQARARIEQARVIALTDESESDA